MSQRPIGDFPFDPHTTNGIELTDYLTHLVNAIESSYSGTSRPTYLAQGGLWVDDSEKAAAIPVIKLMIYDGTRDVLVASVNTASGVIVIGSGTPGAMTYTGGWDAGTNTPTLPAATDAIKGHYYIVTKDGAHDPNGTGSIDWKAGDWIVCDGAAAGWSKVDNTDAVNSVNGQTGIVVLDKDDVGLDHVDNTADADKPIADSVVAALLLKLDATMKGAASGLAELDSSQKILIAQLPDAIAHGLHYMGTWNADTNTPTIPAAASTNEGQYYVVSVAGTTTIDGVSVWAIGDWLVSDGVKWDKIDNSAGGVVSVNGQTGIVLLDKTNIGLSDVDNTSDVDKPVSTASEAAYVKKAGDTMTGGLNIKTASSAGISLFQSDALVDKGNWVIRASGEKLKIQGLNDAGSGSATYFAFERTGTNITRFVSVISGGTVAPWFIVDNTAKQVTVLTEPVNDEHLTNKKYVDGKFVKKDGDTMTGNLKLQSVELSSIAPVIDFKEAGAAADMGNWRIVADAGHFELRIIDDAGAYTKAFEITRVGKAIGAFYISNPRSLSVQGTSGSSLTRKDYVDDKFQVQLTKLDSIELSADLTGDRNSFIDFHASDDPTQVDYSFRIIRNAGINGECFLANKGSGNFSITTNNNVPRLTIDTLGNILVTNVQPTLPEHLTSKRYVDDNFVGSKAGAGGIATSQRIANMVSCTQAEYDALAVKEPTTFYAIRT